MTPTARTHVVGGVIVVTFDRDAKRNAIDAQMTEALWKAVLALGDRDELRAMVITARGEYFSAGIDLSVGAGNRRGSDPEKPSTQPGWAYRRNYRSHHLLYDEIEAVEKPVILAAQGPVLGAGVELAVSCDFRFCTPASSWWLPEIQLGGLPGSGGMSRLARLVGPHRAKWMAMAGQPVTSEQALAWGLVHEIVQADDLMSRTSAFCAELAALPADAVGLAKSTIDLTVDIGDRAAQRTIERIANTTLRVGRSDVEERMARQIRGRRVDGEQR